MLGGYKRTEGNYSKTSLNRPTMGPTLSDPFREVVALGSYGQYRHG